jgi:hypothetical protein
MCHLSKEKCPSVSSVLCFLDQITAGLSKCQDDQVVPTGPHSTAHYFNPHIAHYFRCSPNGKRLLFFLAGPCRHQPMMIPLPCDLLGGAVSSSSPRSPQQIIAQGNAGGYEKFVVIFSPLNSVQCLTPLKRLCSHTIYTGAAGDEPCCIERRGGSKPWMKTTP